MGEEVQTYDLLLLVGEASKVAVGIPASVTLLSPWISNVSYFLGATGLGLSIPNVEFGRNDTVDLLQLIMTLMQNSQSSVRIATMEPNEGKYGDRVYQVWELNFLLKAAEHGARIYFYVNPASQRSIMHPKFLLTSLGVVFGSFNITRAGRYSNIEDGNYASCLSPVYFEKKQRVEDVLKKCEEARISDLEDTLKGFTGTS